MVEMWQLCGLKDRVSSFVKEVAFFCFEYWFVDRCSEALVLLNKIGNLMLG